MEEDNDYTIESRRKNAKRIQQLSLILDNEKINVICAIQLIFNDIRSNNHKLFSIYKEIHITCSAETLKERDTKNLYKLFEEKKTKNIVGLDIPYPKPNYYNFELNSDENIDKTLRRIDKISEQLIPDIF